MGRTEDKLNSIFNDEDVDDILGPAVKKSTLKRPIKNGVASNFADVMAFFEQNNRLPAPDSGNAAEDVIWFKWDGIQKREEFRAQVSHMDMHELLNKTQNEATSSTEIQSENKTLHDDEITDETMSLDDILADKELDELLENNDNAIDILGGRRAIKIHERDNVEQTNREKCPSFEVYRERFEQYRQDLKEGKLVVSDSSQQKLSAGDLFLWGGLIALLSGESMDGDVKAHSGKRLHVVFSNGTEAWLREGSIRRSMYAFTDRGNKVVCKRLIPITEDLFTADDSASADDNTVTGYIYVARTLSKDPGLAKIINSTVKIGVTKNPVAVRVASAEKDPTFLCAPVKIINTFTLHNLNARKVEETLHAFFGDVRLKIGAKDRFGNDVTANEWFLTSPEVVVKAVELIVKNELQHYTFNKTQNNINRIDSKNKAQ